MPALSDRPANWKTLLAFAIIYLVWGTTFLAIRMGVQQVPPFLFAAMRFFAAGVILFLWTVSRGEKIPTGRQWINASFIAVLAFLLNYGPLFWAEQRVPSGIAAVMMATIPLFTAVAEIVLLRTQRLTLRLALALVVGLLGVAVLMSHSLALGGAPVDRIRACALLVAAVSWSLGSVLTRKLSAAPAPGSPSALPQSKLMTSAAQMLAGGFFLALTSGVLGEFQRFHPASVARATWLELAYLIFAGSIVGFTAYIWLIHHELPTKVGTYAYVNPVVAVLLGYFFAGEGLGLRTILGTICVLLSVITITTACPAVPLLSRTGERSAA